MRTRAALVLLLGLFVHLALPLAGWGLELHRSMQPEFGAQRQDDGTAWEPRGSDARDILQAPARQNLRAALAAKGVARWRSEAAAASVRAARRQQHRATYPVRRLLQRRGAHSGDDTSPA